jgi:hypothetical protein
MMEPVTLLGCDKHHLEEAPVSPRSSYLRLETFISICINTLLSLIFVVLIFLGQKHIPVLGLHGIVLDMAPQTFMVTLMGCLIPGLLTRNRLKAGKLAWLDRRTVSGLGQVVGTAVLAAVLNTLAIVGLCWALLPHLLPEGASFLSLLIMKAIYGALLASVVTPWMIMRVTRPRAILTA